MSEANDPNCSVEDTLSKYLDAISNVSPECETIHIEDALSRILCEDIVIKNDYPPFDKALVDGFAIKSSDTRFADKRNPVTLKIIGEAALDSNEKLAVQNGEAIRVSKGSLMPENADAVVKPVDVIEENDVIKVLKSITADTCVTKKGEDIRTNSVFIRKNRKLRPQDIGGIIGTGIRQVKVFKKPVVTIIPTGSELVPLDVEPDASQIISSNGYVLKGFVEQIGGVGKVASIVGDDLNQVKNAISKALEVSDMVLISGGSSSGIRDYTVKAVESIEGANIIAHGVLMRPGHHALLAVVGNKPVIGLPGHPVSNMTVFQVFGKPVLRRLAGITRSFWQDRKETIKIDAFLSKDICSPEGVEDFIRVRLIEEEDGRITAYPYTGESSFLSTLVKSHGMVRIPAECACLYKGDRVEVTLF